MKRMIERKALRLAARARKVDPNAARDAEMNARATEYLAVESTSPQPNEELPEWRERFDDGFGRLTGGAL